MDDRFDFLEIGDQPPRRPAASRVARAPSSLARQFHWAAFEVIGSPGDGVGEFNTPGGIVVDPRGNLWVADSLNHRVQRISPNGEVARIGSFGMKLGEFNEPQAVAWDHRGFVLVLERGNHRVQVIHAADGQASGVFGGVGSALDAFNEPMGMTVNTAHERIIADTGNRRVCRWTQYGKPRDVLGVGQGGGKLFGAPEGIAIARDGRIWVADREKNTLFVFLPDGRLEREFGAGGIGQGYFAEPQDLAFDHSGCLFVAEAGNHRLQIFDPHGNPLQCVERVGPRHEDRLLTPCGVAVGQDDTIYLADTGHHRIFHLRREPL